MQTTKRGRRRCRTLKGVVLMSVRKLLPGSAIPLALLLVLGSAPSAAHALDVRSASGYQSCAGRDRVAVFVELNRAGTITFFEGSARRYQTSGNGASYVYSSGAVSWTVTTSTDLGTVYDSCVGADR